jgi:hypothetical protein
LSIHSEEDAQLIDHEPDGTPWKGIKKRKFCDTKDTKDNLKIVSSANKEIR